VAAPTTVPDSGTENLDDMNDAPAAQASSSPPSLVRQVVTWLCIGFGPVLALITYLPLLQAMLQRQQWIYTIFREHYAAIFGLPSAALLSFMLVVVFEARFDKIEMELANLVKFRGASGPIILWIFCFMSITIAVKMLW
jgi:hypothetical protein